MDMTAFTTLHTIYTGGARCTRRQYKQIENFNLLYQLNENVKKATHYASPASSEGAISTKKKK